MCLGSTRLNGVMALNSVVVLGAANHCESGDVGGMEGDKIDLLQRVREASICNLAGKAYPDD